MGKAEVGQQDYRRGCSPLAVVCDGSGTTRLLAAPSEDFGTLAVEANCAMLLVVAMGAAGRVKSGFNTLWTSDAPANILPRKTV